MKIVKDTGPTLHAGGTVTYRVMADDGTWIGWVGDGREWRGDFYGSRRWWAAWRQDGDSAARWNSGGLAYTRRSAALADLIAVVA